MGNLRDAISRNDLKLPDLSEPRDFLRGDELLRADRKLALALDGVYRRGEFYLRWMQRLSSLAFGTRIGLEMIITAHHAPTDARPDAFAVIDPKQPQCQYPTKELSGVGVAFVPRAGGIAGAPAPARGARPRCRSDSAVVWGRAAKTLQSALGVSADGSIGPATIAALKTANAGEIASKICDARLAFLQGLPTWSTFGKGWGRRVAEVAQAAANMVG